jgi:quercetin dioxygenase-like cupin family protein
MRTVAKWVLLAAVGSCFLVAWYAHKDSGTVAAQPRAAIRLTRIYPGADGQTYAEDIDPKLAPSPTPGLEQSEAVKAASVNFVRFAPTFFEDWHAAHARRYVITLSGRGEIELAGGQKIMLEPGHVLLAEDLTGKGHIARALTADWTAMFVQLDQ